MMPKWACYCVLALSFTLSILGGVLLTLGALWLPVEIEYDKETGKQDVYMGGILISLGILLWFITGLACYAALVKNWFIFDLLAFFNILLFIIYADYGIVVFQLDDWDSPYMVNYETELIEVFDQTKKGWKSYFDYLHQTFECCGVEGSDDFMFRYNVTPPASCCPKEVTSCGNETYYSDGCMPKYLKYLRKNFTISGAICFVVAFLNLITAVFIYFTKRREPSETTLSTIEE